MSESKVDHKARQQPAQDEMLAAIQQFRRLAHDANNALMIISSYSELLREQLPPQHPCFNYTDEILRAVERSQVIVHDMLILGRKASGNAPPPDEMIG